METNDKSILQNDKDFFTSKDLNIGDAINVGHKLRELTVAEWKNNEEYYQSFLVSSNVRDEAEKFLKMAIIMVSLLIQWFWLSQMLFR